MVESRLTAAASAAEGWRALDALLDETERAATADCAEDDFFHALFARLNTLGCTAAAIWQLNPDGAAELRQHRGEDAAGWSATTAAEAIRSGHSRRIERSIYVPWKTAERQAVLETLGPEAQGAADGLLSTLAALAPILTAYAERREHRALRERLEQQTRLEAFALSLSESLDPIEVAYRIANDGRLLVGCERVAVAVRRGRRYKILAVSGAEHIHRRSESVRQLETLCERAAADGRALWDDEKRDRPPQLESALGDYLDLSPATALAILPLSAESPPLGMLICEQYSGAFDAEARARIEALPPRCRPALAAALQVGAIPGHRWWLKLAREGRLQKFASRAAVFGSLAAFLLAALFLIPAQVRVKARGELQPADRREVFAPHDAVVTNVLVDHGAEVNAGDPLLELRSPDLDLELQKTSGEQETVRKQLAAAQAEQLQIRPGDADQRARQRRLTAEIQQREEQLRGLEARQGMLNDQRKELTVASPLTGTVVTWNARQRLASRPLRRGDALLTIADATGPWRLELRVPARTAGRVLAASKDAKVDFVLNTNPGQTLTGVILHVAERVETDEAGESFLPVTVEVDRDALPNRVPGATVTARIHTGRSSLAVAWFHELWDAVRLWTMF